MKNLYLPHVKGIKTVLILFLLTLPIFGHAQNTSSKKNLIHEDILYERLEEFRLVGNIYELRTRCGCGLPGRENVNLNGGVETAPKLFTSKAYPNPAVANTELEIELTADAFVEINFLNINGQLIQSVFNGSLLQGRHTYSIEMQRLPAGMYFLTIHSEKYSATVKVMKV